MSESIGELCPTPPGPIHRGEKRRLEIAAVAQRVFFEFGFSDTTMQAIALRAGASKETLYRHFGSKEGLFAEIVETRAKGFLENLDENFERLGLVEDVLRALGHRILDAMVDPDAISLCRIVIAETPRNPELGKIFFRSGPDRVLNRLTEFLAAARERGELNCVEPETAARLFLGSIFSSYHLKRLCLLDWPVPSPSQLRLHVEEAVDMFMLKYGK